MGDMEAKVIGETQIYRLSLPVGDFDFLHVLLPPSSSLQLLPFGAQENLWEEEKARWGSLRWSG